MAAPAPSPAIDVALRWLSLAQLLCSACGVFAVHIRPDPGAGVGFEGHCRVCDANRAYALDDDRAQRRAAAVRREKTVWTDQA